MAKYQSLELQVTGQVGMCKRCKGVYKICHCEEESVVLDHCLLVSADFLKLPQVYADTLGAFSLYLKQFFF